MLSAEGRVSRQDEVGIRTDRASLELKRCTTWVLK